MNFIGDQLKFFVTFSASGSQSRDWREASVTITAGSAYRVVFEVVNGNRRGDIAIDDYSVTPGACGVRGNCNFDQGFCTWTNDHAYDSFDWTLGHGSTASSSTGPTNDHTQGNSKGSYIKLCKIDTQFDNEYLLRKSLKATNPLERETELFYLHRTICVY